MVFFEFSGNDGIPEMPLFGLAGGGFDVVV